jgi:transcriptional regulator with XRE-family HTH domain
MTPDSTHVEATSFRSASRDPSPLELGRRIKMLRVSRGLTLKDLEKRGGISATHVSEIERGKASPTVGALGRIAHALGLRPATLVEPHVFPEITITRAADRKGRQVQWGAAMFEPVTEPLRCATLGAQLVTLPVGREPALVHRHEGEEWAMVMTGTAEISMEDKTYVLREGDSIHFRAHHMHGYANLSSSPSVLLVGVLPRIAL